MKGHLLVKVQLTPEIELTSYAQPKSDYKARKLISKTRAIVLKKPQSIKLSD